MVKNNGNVSKEKKAQKEELLAAVLFGPNPPDLTFKRYPAPMGFVETFLSAFLR